MAHLGKLSEAKQQMFQFLIEQRFPKSIKDISLMRDLERDVVLVCITFNNGIMLRTDEDKVMENEFQAQCVMAHDLPCGNA